MTGEAEAMGANARATKAREAMQLLMEGMAEVLEKGGRGVERRERAS